MKSSGRIMSPRLRVLAALLIALLAVKYLWSLTVSPVPFGYDAGIYRFLFLRHADGWPPLFIAPLPEWAQSHPLGLFAFSSLLVRMGIPADALIGWMWNMFAMVPSCALAWVFLRRNGPMVGVAVLAAALLSVAQHEGFIAMYWKVFVALAWSVFAFSLLERRSRWWVLCGMFAIATHLQVGLILGLSVASAFAFQWLSGYRRESIFLLWSGAVTAVLGLAWYLPNYGQAIRPTLDKALASVNPVAVFIAFIALLVLAAGIRLAAPAIFRRRAAPPRILFSAALLCIAVAVLGGGVLSGVLLPDRIDPASGSFLSLQLYAQLSYPLIILGLLGFLLSVRNGEQLGSVWQWALVWCAALVFSRFFFYLRFLLLLDFFLLPFAAQMLVRLWFVRQHAFRWLAVALLSVQAILTVQRLQALRPDVLPSDLASLSAVAAAVPPDAVVVSLDNYIAPWVLGMLPHAQVAGPGIFASPPYGAWERFMYGDAADRRAFYDIFPSPLFLYAGSVFLAYYPPEVTAAILADDCLQPTQAARLYRVECPAR